VNGFCRNFDAKNSSGFVKNVHIKIVTSSETKC
jgi:hypothetical protein